MTKQARPPSRSAVQIHSLAERVASKLGRLSPIERRVADFFVENREETLVASAVQIAERVGTSDATVVRTAKSLGYAGLADLRRDLANDLRADLAPAARLARTLGEVGSDVEAAFRVTVGAHLASLERLQHEISPTLFEQAVAALVAARRVAIFGIGPSSAIAEYFAIQLARFGTDTLTLANTGLLHADDLHRLRAGDALVMLAYTRPYREIEALLGRAKELRLTALLLTDSLQHQLRHRVDLVLPVARGSSDMFSMHTATLGLIEALLVGIATRSRTEVLAELVSLNRLRTKIAGTKMDLGTSAPQGRKPIPRRP